MTTDDSAQALNLWPDDAEELREAADDLERRGDSDEAAKLRTNTASLNGSGRRVCRECRADMTGEHKNRKVCRRCKRPAGDKRRDIVAAAVETVVAPDGDASERLVHSMGDFLRYDETARYWHPVTADRVTADITAADIDPADVRLHADCKRAVTVAAVQAATPDTAAESLAAWHLDTGEPAPPGAAWTGDVVGIDRSTDPPKLTTAPVDPLVLRRQPPIPWTWSPDRPDPADFARIWAFLVGLTGSEEMATALVADIGRMLCGDWTEPSLVFLRGVSRAGKSTAIELIAGLVLGPSALASDGQIAHVGYHGPKSFADLGARFGLGGLARWRLIAIDDLPRMTGQDLRDGDTVAGLAVAKSLAEGKPVQSEAKNRDPVTVRADCGIVIASNHPLVVTNRTDDAGAWAARLRPYYCATPRADDDQRRGYGAELVRAEGQAFARYAVHTYADQIARGTFSAIPEAMAAQRQIATDEGLPPLQAWARGYKPGGWTARDTLTTDATEHLGEPVTARDIGAALRDVHGAEAAKRQPRKGVTGFTVHRPETSLLDPA